MTDFGEISHEKNLVRFNCRQRDQMWFDLMQTYGDLGCFLTGISSVAILLFIVTSLDSSSLVLDCLTANGDPGKQRKDIWYSKVILDAEICIS